MYSFQKSVKISMYISKYIVLGYSLDSYGYKLHLTEIFVFNDNKAAHTYVENAWKAVNPKVSALSSSTPTFNFYMKKHIFFKKVSAKTNL